MSSFLMKREWNYFAGTTKPWKASHQHLMPCYSMQREQPIRLASGQEVKSHNKEGLHQNPGVGHGMNAGCPFGLHSQ